MTEEKEQKKQGCDEIIEQLPKGAMGTYFDLERYLAEMKEVEKQKQWDQIFGNRNQCNQST